MGSEAVVPKRSRYVNVDMRLSHVSVLRPGFQTSLRLILDRFQVVLELRSPKRATTLREAYHLADEYMKRFE